MDLIKKKWGFENSLFLIIFLLLITLPLGAEEFLPTVEQKSTYNSKKFGIGVGINRVIFDIKLKSTSKTSGRSIFLDVEGNFDLPKVSTVYSFYGAYRFNNDHSILINYFGVKRSSSLVNLDDTFGDIVIIDAAIEINDNSKFFNLTYGYNLFRNSTGTITFVAGVNAINLDYNIQANGELSVDGTVKSKAILFDENFIIPLPLIGFNFRYNYSKDFAISTKVSLVAGAYKNVKAGILQTSFNSIYNLTDHVGLLFGITYFDANIEIEKEDFNHILTYGYKGVTAGVYFAF